jgi:TetR/AcrR family transcriptional regulator, transcriptional repressor for nem operon
MRRRLSILGRKMTSEMPNVNGTGRPGKRERLVAAAADLMHRQGVQRTKIAEVAEAADVPPGNVYYYFKTRDDMVRAVAEDQAAQFTAMLAAIERQPDPAGRLKALVRSWDDMRDIVARYGCPVGNLGSELARNTDGLERYAPVAMGLIIDWAQAQFAALGRPDARDLAITLLAGVQGAALLASTLRDPLIVTREVSRLGRWIDSLA